MLIQINIIYTYLRLFNRIRLIGRLNQKWSADSWRIYCNREMQILSTIILQKELFNFFNLLDGSCFIFCEWFNGFSPVDMSQLFTYGEYCIGTGGSNTKGTNHHWVPFKFNLMNIDS